MKINKSLFKSIANVPSRNSNNRSNRIFSTPYGEQNAGPGQWQEQSSETTVNEGGCFNLLGQTVACDDVNCIGPNCGSTTTVTPGTGDFFLGGTAGMPEEESFDMTPEDFDCSCYPAGSFIPLNGGCVNILTGQMNPNCL